MTFKDIVRKSILFGLGAYQITKEEVEDFVKDLQKDETITPQEGKKMIQEIVKAAEKKMKRPNEELKKSMERIVKSVINELGVATKKDIAALKTEMKKPRKVR
ncbi:phasin family protein [Candidatus Dojkabacteria bacterium]|nr:phasin family protein [Candidatus Dojkabacteria bacterium]